MKSEIDDDFLERYRQLPVEVRRMARSAYSRFAEDPFHPGLQFKLVDDRESLWSARVGLNYRTLGFRDGETITWYWIGTHAEYDQLLRRR